MIVYSTIVCRNIASSSSNWSFHPLLDVKLTFAEHLHQWDFESGRFFTDAAAVKQVWQHEETTARGPSAHKIKLKAQHPMKQPYQALRCRAMQRNISTCKCCKQTFSLYFESAFMNAVLTSKHEVAQEQACRAKRRRPWGSSFLFFLTAYTLRL